MSSLNVNSLNQGTAFNVDINALNAYNQNNSLTSTGISVSSTENLLEKFTKTDLSGMELDFDSLERIGSEYSYTTKSGKTIESDSPYYSEYAAEFDDVSYDFRVNGKTSDLSDSDILEQMVSKYADLRNDILENYSGEEAEERLAQLDKAYEDMIETNVSYVLDNPLKDVSTKAFIYKMWGEIAKKLTNI